MTQNILSFSAFDEIFPAKLLLWIQGIFFYLSTITIHGANAVSYALLYLFLERLCIKYQVVE